MLDAFNVVRDEVPCTRTSQTPSLMSPKSHGISQYGIMSRDRLTNAVNSMDKMSRIAVN